MQTDEKRIKGMTKAELVDDLMYLMRDNTEYGEEKFKALYEELIEREFEERLEDIWGYEIANFDTSYSKEFIDALEKGDKVSFVYSCRGSGSQEKYVEEHWDMLDKVMSTLKAMVERERSEVDVL